MKRPLLAVTLLHGCGILAAELFSPPLWPLLGLLLLFAAVAVSSPRFRLLLLYPLLILSGLANSAIHTAILSPDDLRLVLGTEPHLAEVQGQLLETPSLRVYQQEQQTSLRTVARMQVSSLRLGKGEWQHASGRLAISTASPLTNFFSGQTIVVTGVLAVPRPAVAEGTFDYRQYLKRQGIYYQLTAETENDWRIVLASPAPPLADRFSTWARRALALGLPIEDESLRLEWALTLGWRTALTEDACEPFVRAATYHIFAVDGLRMAIVFGIFYTVLRAAGLPRALCGAVLIPVIWFYVALTGWPASAIRASIMLTIIISGWVLKRPSDPTNSLFAAAIIILVWDPQQLFQAGFQLSFFVVLCLIVTIPPLFGIVERALAPDPWLPKHLVRRWHPVIAVPARYLGDLAVTSFAAWIGSLPLVAYYFNIVTPVSTPANILAVPLCVLVLISNLISLVLAGWLPGAAELFNHAGWFGMECIRVSSEWFANWPAAYWYIKAPSWFTTCLYYAIFFGLMTGWLFRPAHRRWKIAALSAALCIWIVNFGWQAFDPRLTVLPAGGGTALYCDWFGSKPNLLIDVGPSNSVQFVAKPFLRAQGVNQLPRLLLTHGDVHHTGGTEPLVRLFNIPRIYTSPVRFRSVVYRRMLERLSKTPAAPKQLERNEVISRWTVLHPEAKDRFAKADDGALVLRTTINGTRVLLLSDLGRAGQDMLVERVPDLAADIVVAGLPAAGEPLSDALIDAIRPKLIIISDCDFPVSESASPKLRARLRQKSIPTLYTRETGAVTLIFRNGTFGLKAMNGLRLNSAALELLPEQPVHDAPPQKEEGQEERQDDD